MKRVFITGMSGTGKSEVIRALGVRGYKAIDTDYDGWSELIDLPPESAPSGIDGLHDWVWREERIEQLLATEDADVLFISGGASNQVKFYRRFDHIVLLTAPTSLMIERLTTRTNNPYGKSPAELARILELKRTIEPRLREIASLEVDTAAPLDEVVERILAGISEQRSAPRTTDEFPSR